MLVPIVNAPGHLFSVKKANIGKSLDERPFLTTPVHSEFNVLVGHSSEVAITSVRSGPKE
jgi:hypothetical protein